MTQWWEEIPNNHQLVRGIARKNGADPDNANAVREAKQEIATMVERLDEVNMVDDVYEEAREVIAKANLDMSHDYENQLYRIWDVLKQSGDDPEKLLEDCED